MHASIESSFHPTPSRVPSLPVFPLPVLHGRQAVPIDLDDDDTEVELAYPRDGVGDLVPTYGLNCPNGTGDHFMPDRVPVFAVRDGEITYAAKEGHAYAMVIDHGNGWATFYGHLEHMFASETTIKGRRRCTQRVKAGDILGWVGSPNERGFKRLRFELWTFDEDGELSAVNPRGELSRWRALPWSEDRFAQADIANAA